MKTRLFIAPQALLSIFIVGLIAHSVCFADTLTVKIEAGEWEAGLAQGPHGGDRIITGVLAIRQSRANQ